jgi:hypothetical protein
MPIKQYVWPNPVTEFIGDMSWERIKCRHRSPWNANICIFHWSFLFMLWSSFSYIYARGEIVRRTVEGSKNGNFLVLEKGKKLLFERLGPTYKTYFRWSISQLPSTRFAILSVFLSLKTNYQLTYSFGVVEIFLGSSIWYEANLVSHFFFSSSSHWF